MKINFSPAKTTTDNTFQQPLHVLVISIVKKQHNVFWKMNGFVTMLNYIRNVFFLTDIIMSKNHLRRALPLIFYPSPHLTAPPLQTSPDTFQKDTGNERIRIMFKFSEILSS